jgi:hypothetical protein
MIIDNVGETTTIKELQEYLYGLYDRGDYSHLWYQLIPLDDNRYRLVLDAPIQPVPYELFSTALDFSGQMIESNISDFTLKTAFQKWFGQDSNSSIALELWLSEYPTVQFSLAHNVLGSNFLVSANAYMNQNAEYFFDGDSVESIYSSNRSGISITTELPFWRTVDIALKPYGEYHWIDFRMGVESFDEISVGRLGLESTLSVDTLDRIIAPEKGLRGIFILDGALNTYGKPVIQTKIAGELYISPFDGFVINPRTEVQSLLLGELSQAELPSLGRAMIIHGFYLQELRADNVAMIGVNLRQQLFSLPLIIGNEVYLQLAVNGASTRSKAIIGEEEYLSFYLGGSAGLVASTKIGELQVNFGMNQDGRFSSYIGLSTSTSFYNMH